MKKVICILICLMFMSTQADDTLWTKITTKDTAVSTQTKYAPVILPSATQIQPKSKIPNYILGGSTIALGILSGLLAIDDAIETSHTYAGHYNGFCGPGDNGATNTRTHCVYFILSLSAIISGIAIILQ
jgi:hypothetical protein